MGWVSEGYEGGLGLGGYLVEVHHCLFAEGFLVESVAADCDPWGDG